MRASIGGWVAKRDMNPPVLLYVLKTLLTLLHPFVPFVTETIWTHLEPKNLLIAEPWPKADKKLIFAM